MAGRIAYMGKKEAYSKTAIRAYILKNKKKNKKNLQLDKLRK